jgi:uncharacterized membrane protein YedE/YeeE
MHLIYGITTGILFGILLQSAEITRYDRQIGALRLKDMTLFKFMLSAVIVAAIGIHLFRDLGLITLSVKPTSLGAQILGGVVFGVGWGLLGYCPGTAGGALGEGRLDALGGIAGFFAGGTLYAWLYPFFKRYVIPLGNYGNITVPQALELNSWLVIAALTLLCLVLFVIFEKLGL